MKYKSFSVIDTNLSALGLGTWQFSGKGDWSAYEKETAIKIIHGAIDGGINFVDTAPVYGLGHAESIVGEGLKGKRDKVFLATKVGLPWDGGNNVRNDLTEASIIKEIDTSLSRLQTDYVDLYQIHWPDPNTAIEETMEALAKLKQQGKIRYIGVSNFSEDLMARAMKITDVASHQGLYNMIEQNAATYHNIPLGYEVKNSLLDKLASEGQFFLPYSPLMQGLLAGKETFVDGVRMNNPELHGEQLEKNIQMIQEITEFIEKPIHEIALNWLISQETVGPVIAGCTSLDQLNGNLKALDWDLAENQIKLIDDILL